jgi:hypothetical protein
MLETAHIILNTYLPLAIQELHETDFIEKKEKWNLRFYTVMALLMTLRDALREHHNVKKNEKIICLKLLAIKNLCYMNIF